MFTAYQDLVMFIESANNMLGRRVASAIGLIKITEVPEDVCGEIGPVNSEPVKIELREGAVPYNLSSSRHVPLLEKVKAELERMDKNGIIEKIIKPTDWCCSMVPVGKRGSHDIRICVDLQRLNPPVKREKYTMPILDNILCKVAGSKVFSTLDVSSKLLLTSKY